MQQDLADRDDAQGGGIDGQNAAGGGDQQAGSLGSSSAHDVSQQGQAPQHQGQGDAHGDHSQAPGASGVEASQGAAPVEGFREVARQYGYDLSQFPDDYSALQHLVSELRQAQQLKQMAQYGQVYLQHHDQFQRFLQSQQQGQSGQQQQQQKKWWNPPEFNPAWRSLVYQDDNGNWQVRPGAPPDVLPKFLAYEQYRKDFADRFLQDPEAALGDMVEARAQAVAERLVQQHLGGYQERVFADNYVQRNSHWLYQRDQAGNYVRHPVSGEPVLTPEGQRFKDYVLFAEEAGVRNVARMQQIAQALLERDLLADRYRSELAQQQNQQIKQQAQSGAAGQNRAPNFAASLQSSDASAQNRHQSYADMLRQAFKENGITDSDLVSAR